MTALEERPIDTRVTTLVRAVELVINNGGNGSRKAAIEQMVNAAAPLLRHADRDPIASELDRKLIELRDGICTDDDPAVVVASLALRVTSDAVVDDPQAELAAVLSAWRPVDLAPVLAGKHTRPLPTLLRRSDGSALLYAACVNGFHGDSGIGKGWIAMLAAAEALRDGHRVMILDYEATADEIVARLRSLAVPAEVIYDGFDYISPPDEASDLAVEVLEQNIIDRGVALTIIDSVGEAFAVEGIDEDKDKEVGPWMRRVPRRLAATGTCVMLIDHATKAADNPLHPSGSKRKRAAITGASYLVTTHRPPTCDAPGTLTITCAKDRHGSYARGSVVGTLEIVPYPDDGVTATLHPKHPAKADDTDPRAVVVARAIVRLLAKTDRPLSGRELFGLLPVKASNELKREGLAIAIGAGAISDDDGPRRSRLHRYVRPMEGDTADET